MFVVNIKPWTYRKAVHSFTFPFFRRIAIEFVPRPTNNVNNSSKHATMPSRDHCQFISFIAANHTLCKWVPNHGQPLKTKSAGNLVVGSLGNFSLMDPIRQDPEVKSTSSSIFALCNLLTRIGNCVGGGRNFYNRIIW